MKLKATAAVLSAAALFAACSDEVVNVNDEAKEKATFSFKIVDGYTGEAIQGASVYSVLDDENKEANELGIVTWKKNVIGNYVYYVSAEGYKTIQVGASASEVGQGNVARVPDVFKEVRMVKGGVKASGSVLYEDLQGNKKAAAKVTVFANCGAQFVPSEMTETTSANGEYAFDDLPAGAECDITVGQEKIDSKYYFMAGAAKNVGDEHRAGDIVHIGSILLTPVAAQMELISTNLDKMDSTSSIKIVFSSEIDKDSLLNKWSVTKSGEPVLATVSVASDGKTIVIKPFSGKWENKSTYRVSGTAFSKDGAHYNFAATSFQVGVTTAKLPGQVTDLNAALEDGSTTWIDLTWTAPKSGYEGVNVYYKTNKMNDWILYDYYYGMEYGTASEPIEIRLTSLGMDYKTVEFIVLPFNEDGDEADLAKAKSVKFTVPAEEE